VSGVVLRCPNCGTTQNAEGQCEACHESPVRYFCLNHAPGVWLDAPACSQCGARFGDPVASRGESVPIEPPKVSRAGVRTPPVRPDYDDSSRGPWDTEEFSGIVRPSDRSARADPLRMLLSAMAAAARARSERGRDSGYDELAPRPRTGGGCLGRLFMLLILIFAFMILAPVLLGAFLGSG
jgi:hypothetical protein